MTDGRRELSVFISHKLEDAEVALGIKRELALCGGNQMRLFVSEDVLPGENWFHWIQDKLAHSNLLLLVFTNPAATWDWCLYEAGLFVDLDALDDAQAGRIICIHSRDTQQPGPLRHLKPVPAEIERVASFLRELFGGTALTRLQEPLNSAFASDEEAVGAVARRICDLFERPTYGYTHYYNRHFFLRIEAHEAESGGRVPGSAVIRADEATLALFGVGRRRQSWRWEELTSAWRRRILKQGERRVDERWMEELEGRVFAASRGEIVDPIRSTLRGAVDGLAYRPLLTEVKFLEDGALLFKFLLVSDVGGQATELPRGVALLLTAIRAGIRLQYEVLEPPPGQLEDNVGERLDAILGEARSRGLMDESCVRIAFEGSDDHRYAAELFATWEDGVGGLRGVLADNGDDSEARLEGLRALNRKFLTVMAERYRLLIDERLE